MSKDSPKIEKIADDVRMITPRHVLREKIGYGGIDKRLLTRAQEVIEEAPVEFEPFAKQFLARLRQNIDSARTGSRDKKAIDAMTRPVMELKANGGMFRYNLISDIADTLLDFLESLKDLNDDALDVVEVHHSTLGVIITSRLTGDGGREGAKLISELRGACTRYMKKYNVISKN